MTLIEVTLVVMIIGILMLLGIPALNGAKKSAEDRSAQASLRIAVTNAKAIRAETDNFADADPTALTKAEPSLRFTVGASLDPKVVSVDNRGSAIVLASRSDSGICYVIGDAANAAGTVYQNLGLARCQASDVAAIPTATPADEHAAVGGDWARGW
ncbi:MAG: type II secretion system protein [Acidimicrobiia bacterium]|nr:type II secretion system protein [Acidimicrobiia bacterium]